MATYSVTPLEAVGLEGFFGLLTILLASPVLIHFKSRSDFFDLQRGWHQMTSNPTVLGSAFAIATSIGFYNFFGMSVTRHISATMRSIIDTCRTITIWIVSLGLGWEMLVWPWSLMQVSGFALLVYVRLFIQPGPHAHVFCTATEHSCSTVSSPHHHSFGLQRLWSTLQCPRTTTTCMGVLPALLSKIEKLLLAGVSTSRQFSPRTWDLGSMSCHPPCQRLTQRDVTKEFGALLCIYF